MSKKDNQRISIKFVLFLIISITGIIIYCLQPTKENQIKDLSYEELLEKSHRTVSRTTYIPEQVQTVQNNTNQIQSNEIINNITEESERKPTNYKQDENFNKLLEELKLYPSKSSSSAKIVTERLLKYLGYNGYEIKVNINNLSDKSKKPEGIVVAGNFNIKTGQLNLNQELLTKLDITELTAIIAHELDHFDKIAKICKSMGTENFFKFTKDNNFEITNKDFWIKSSQKADITDFDNTLYQDALKRFIKQNQLETTSIYADLYAISEAVRNPLEISAYELSDYILMYYNIKPQESFTQKLANQFNKVDWEIYNITQRENQLTNDRIAIFDYVLMKAIIQNNKKYSNIVNNCINKNGDLTPFREEFKNDNKGIFDKNTLGTEESYKNIISILNEMENILGKGLSIQDKAEALKLYIYTLKSNMEYNNSFTQLTNSIKDYLTYTKENKIENPKDTLKMYLILICLENNLNKNTNKEKIKLYYLKIPQLLDDSSLNNKKSKKYKFIYENSEFIKELNKSKQSNSDITEQKLLNEMLIKTASEIKY